MIAFGDGEPPEEGELVLWDGFDEPAKEDAVRFFSGKTWPEVLTHLRQLKDAPVFGAAYFLEEWSVLRPRALAYYGRAYLDFLQETRESARPDEEFVFYFLGQLYQVFFMHQGSPFDSVLTALLRRVVEQVGEQAAAGTFEYFGEDIERQAAKLLITMSTHGF